jgi:hypothetical protein
MSNELEQYVARSYMKDLESAGSFELKGTDEDIMTALDMMARINQQRISLGVSGTLQKLNGLKQKTTQLARQLH